MGWTSQRPSSSCHLGTGRAKSWPRNSKPTFAPDWQPTRRRGWSGLWARCLKATAAKYSKGSFGDERMPLAAHLPWTQVLTYAESDAVALLPVGSTEAHGPHLPLAVDCLIAEEVCRRVDARLAARGELGLTFPPVCYGVTDFAAACAGTVTTSSAAGLAYLTDVVASIASFFRRVAIINHHLEPAHFRLVHQAAENAAKRTGAAIAVPDHRKKPIAPLLGEEFT